MIPARGRGRFPIATPVIVNLVDADHAIRGSLLRAGGTLELRNAELITTDGTRTPLDGTIYVPLERVDFVQELRA